MSDSDSSSDSSYDSSESRPSGSSLSEGSITGKMESVLQRPYDKEVRPPELVIGETWDPEALKRAGNNLFRSDDLIGAIEKYKKAIAAGSEGGMQTNIAKTYGNIAHCYNNKKKMQVCSQGLTSGSQSQVESPPSLHKALRQLQLAQKPSYGFAHIAQRHGYPRGQFQHKKERRQSILRRQPRQR